MKRPPLPRSIRILGQRFAVKSERILADGHSLGQMDTDMQVMHLATEQGADNFVDTFVHETLHGIFDKAGYTGQSMPGDTNEEMVNRLAPILLLFIRQNPKAVAYILGRYWL